MSNQTTREDPSHTVLITYNSYHYYLHMLYLKTIPKTQLSTSLVPLILRTILSLIKHTYLAFPSINLTHFHLASVARQPSTSVVVALSERVSRQLLMSLKEVSSAGSEVAGTVNTSP